MVKELVVLVSEGALRPGGPCASTRPRCPGRPLLLQVNALASQTRASSPFSGSEFEKGFISWKVLRVGWSETVEEVVVWYYDVEMAAELDITEEDCELARENGIDFVPLEYSSIAEMREWIRASARPN